MPGEIQRQTGRGHRAFVFLETVKLNRDFRQITKFQAKREYYEGDDEYLGRSPVKPWKQLKNATFSFSFEEDNATNVHNILQSVDDLELAGQRANWMIQEYIENNDGTVSKVTYTDCVLKFEKVVGGKGEKTMWNVDGRAGTILAE